MWSSFCAWCVKRPLAVGYCLRALRATFDHAICHDYMRGVYTIACQTTWDDRLKPDERPYPISRDVRGGVRSNADGSPIRTPTVAGNSGFIAQGSTNAHIANFFEDNKNLLPVAMLFYFRNMTISGRDIAEMLVGHNFTADRYTLKEDNILQWRDNWQHKIWSEDFFLSFVREVHGTFSRSIADKS